MPYMLDTSCASTSSHRNEQQHDIAPAPRIATSINTTAAVLSGPAYNHSTVTTHALRQYKQKASSAPALFASSSLANDNTKEHLKDVDVVSLPADMTRHGQSIPYALLRYLRSREQHEILALGLTQERARGHMFSGPTGLDERKRS